MLPLPEELEGTADKAAEGEPGGMEGKVPIRLNTAMECPSNHRTEPSIGSPAMVEMVWMGRLADPEEAEPVVSATEHSVIRVGSQQKAPTLYLSTESARQVEAHRREPMGRTETPMTPSPAHFD